MLKQILKRFFSAIGYSVTKTPRISGRRSSLVKVGRYLLKINEANGIKYCYENHKDYGSQLTRLTLFLYQYFKEMTVLDIGANLGDSVALIKSGAEVPVHCVEGDKTIINFFLENTVQFEHIKLTQAFLSDHVGKLACTFSKEGHNLTIDVRSGKPDQQYIDLITIDTLYKNKEIDLNCKLVKIDTEGFDLKIIRGADIFLRSARPVLLFEFNREALANIEADAFEIFNWLKQREYNALLFYESDGRFMFSADLDQIDFLRQLYEYIDGKNSRIYYVDIMAFHMSDDGIAKDFIGKEETYRATTI